MSMGTFPLFTFKTVSTDSDADYDSDSDYHYYCVYIPHWSRCLLTSKATCK